MSVINIRPVESGQSKAVIGIAGVSGSGKTYSALLIARGMVNKASEIGFLDTENKRGSLYAEILDGKFMIGDLYPPFSPSRYATAIKQFQDAGVKVLVIDSGSHEWEGEGGCEDIANLSLLQGKKMANWIGAKREHKPFMNTLLQANMDIVVTLRAREKTDFKDPMKPVSLGIQPICEKNFMFELTASILMNDEGKTQKHLKVPSVLKEAFGDGQGYLGIETGQKIRAWLDKGKKENPEITRIKSEALLICEQGYESLNNFWKSIPKELKSEQSLLDHFALCTESAKAYDAQNSDGEEFDKLAKIQELFDAKKESLGVAEQTFIQGVIDDKDETNYDKVIYQLNKVQNEQQAK